MRKADTWASTRARSRLGELTFGTFNVRTLRASLAFAFVLLCFVSSLFVVFALFLFLLCLVGAFFVDVPLMVSCPASHVLLDWQPRFILLSIL